MASKEIIEQPAARRFAKIAKERTAGFVFFLGSGPSQDLGYPSWDGLVNHLLDEVVQGASGLHPTFNLQSLIKELKTKNNWEKIEYIKEKIGKYHYRSSIKEIFSDQHKSNYGLYPDFWRMSPRGIVTLNLDTACHDAFPTHDTDRVNVVAGMQASSRAAILRSGVPFLVHAHGLADDSNSWVLTPADRRRLLEEHAYASFLNLLFSSFTVVFYGVYVADFAASGQLEYLRTAAIDTPDHFWLVRDPGPAEAQLGRDLGVQIIKLPEHTTSAEGFSAFADEVSAFRSTDNQPPPIFSEQASSLSELVDPDQILSFETNEIRQYLNSQSKNFFLTDGSFDYEAYASFCVRYKKALRIATLVDYQSDNEKWMNATVTAKIGGGIFGEVFSGTIDNRTIALKVARDEVRRDRLMLNNFRRGVDSMKILSASKVPGVPRILDASELPPYIIMELVDGKSLDSVIFERLAKTPSTKVEIVATSAEIIHRCHKHEKTILHRDLRPSNIIVQGDFWDTGEIDGVTVIDFDLSWHLGASEEEYILTNASALGYLAPEQLDSGSGQNPRSAYVDVYGCGMLLYFVLAERHPPSNASMLAGWHEELTQHVRRSRFAYFSCASNRFARLIKRSTAWEQDLRIPLDVFVFQIRSFLEAIRTNTVQLQEIALDEVFFEMAGYRYDFDFSLKKAIYSSVAGLTMTGQALGDQDVTAFSITLVSTGDRHRGKLSSFFSSIDRFANEKLKSVGAYDIKVSTTLGQISISWSYRFEEPEECKRHARAYSEITSFMTSH